MIYTKGNVLVNEIKIGDIHYECSYGVCIKVKVISLPTEEVREDDSYWTWQSKLVDSDEEDNIIDYGVSTKYPHYGPNLYDYEAYKSIKTLNNDN